VKAQFKYAFIAGLSIRGHVFAVIVLMNAVFIALGSMGRLPVAAQITAISLSGISICVMAVVNIIGDVNVVRRMYSAPGAYFCALTPVPRWKTLLASLLAMAVMDIVTMAAAISGTAWISLQLYAGQRFFGDVVSGARLSSYAVFPDILFGFWLAVLLLAGYFLTWMVILFCVTAHKSLFFGKTAGGLLTAALAVGLIYVLQAMGILLAPFGEVVRWGFYITVTVGRAGMVANGILGLLQAAALFCATTALMERKMNL
jgi:hypothetical protein